MITVIAIENEMSEKYEVKIPNNIEMTIVLTDMTFKYSENELISKLNKQNNILENSKIEIIKIFETKRNNGTIYNAKLKINNESYIKVISAQKLNVGGEKCRVFDGTQIIQCFKCKGFNHKSIDCRNEITCLKCHGNHNTKQCNKEYIHKCINCKRMNSKLNLGLDENHETTDKECPVYVNKLKLKKKRMGLNE